MVLYPHLIQPGSTVTFHYAIRLPDGTEVESSFGDEPETLVIGDGSLLPGFELAMAGLKQGDRQTLSISPDQAYGTPDPAARTKMPRDRFPADIELESGLVISFDTPEGDAVPGTILEVSGDVVTVDFNHPLAGHEVVLEVEILAVVAPPDEEE